MTRGRLARITEPEPFEERENDLARIRRARESSSPPPVQETTFLWVTLAMLVALLAIAVLVDWACAVIIRHLRRAMANHTECDPDDERVFADGPEDCTCQECLDAYARRKEEWFDDIVAQRRLRVDPPPMTDAERKEDTKPGRIKR